MSTYGTSVALDSPDGDALVRAVAELVEEGADAYRSTGPDGWTRVVVAMPSVQQSERLATLLGSLGTGRGAVAEDNDEFGASWTVLAAADGRVRTVHRRYVLNADQTDAVEVAEAIQDLGGVDPRQDDVAGADAAAATAALFGVPPGPVVEAEEASGQAWSELGTVGGPFPWWSALRLPWPGPEAGALVDPAPPPAANAKDRVLRPGSKGFSRWLAETVAPRLGSDVEWAGGRTGIYAVPVEWFIKGLVTSRSSGGGFYVLAYTAPLVTARALDVIAHNYSRTVMGPEGQTFSLPSMSTAEHVADEIAHAWCTQMADAFVDRLASPEGFLEYVDGYRRDAPDQGPELYAAHGVPAGACHLLLGNDDDARRELSHVPAQPSSDHPQHEIDLAQELLRRLSEEGRAAAIDRLAPVREAALASQLRAI